MREERRAGYELRRAITVMHGVAFGAASCKAAMGRDADAVAIRSGGVRRPMLIGVDSRADREVAKAFDADAVLVGSPAMFRLIGGL